MMRRWLWAAAAALLLNPAVSARELTIALVQAEGNRVVAIEDKQALWISPFGGWVATAWPFSMHVDGTPILAYASAEKRLLAQSGAGALTPTDEKTDELLAEIGLIEAKVSPEDLRTFRLDRKASSALSLGKGQHRIEPFGIEFTIGAAGAPASQDPRLRVDAEGGRMDVVCHPVVFKTFVEGRTVPAPLQVSCGGTALLAGLESMLAEYERKIGPSGGAPAGNAFRRLTLFLPASAPGQAYEANGVKFDVGADGRVTLAAESGAECVGGREIRLAARAAKPAPAVAPARATGQRAVSVSLYTTRNRGLLRRGDPLDLFWSVRSAAVQPAAEFPVTLAGQGLKVAVGRIALPGLEAGGVASGVMKLDTAALAPGEYEATAELPGATCYPLRFRVCQREPLSDYTVYSYVYGQASPYAGSPVNAYYGGVPGGPGLGAVLKEVDASLDPALADGAKDPAGPAPEKFVRPTPEEARLMALAALGMRTVLQYPTISHAEDWNPKHTLPEDLASMRRRLALFVQPLAAGGRSPPA